MHYSQYKVRLRYSLYYGSFPVEAIPVGLDYKAPLKYFPQLKTGSFADS